MRAQLERDGTNVAKRGKRLFRRERFQRLTRGKKSTLDNFRVMSLTTTFEPHRTNRCFEGLQEPRRCPTKLFRIVRQDDRHISHCKGLSFQSSACGCSPAGTGAILLVVWSRSSSAHRTDRLVRDRDAPVLSAAYLRDTTLRSSVVSALASPQHPIAQAISSFDPKRRYVNFHEG
jgi:hypothetical protein